MKSAWRLVALVLATVAVTACNGDDGGTDPDETVLPEHCNPLSTDHCLLPWPSSFYLAEDASTETGYRVAYPAEALPANGSGVGISPERYNRLDGFSVGSQPLVYFAQGVGAAGLPAADDLAGSVSDESLIWIIDFESGERVPLFAEIDANAKRDAVPALIIRPQRPLRHDARYVVVLRQGLQDAAGELLAPPAPFRRLRDGAATESPTLESERQRMQEVFDFLEQQQVDLDQLVLAWGFRTASASAVTANLVQMVDTARAELPTGGPAYTVTNLVDPSNDPELLLQVHGTFDAPSFLASDGPDAVLGLDAQGKPQLRGMQAFEFRLNIPRCAEDATGPLPVLIFGHGLFIGPDAVGSDYHKMLHQRLCMVEVAARWKGLSATDVPSLLSSVIPDFNNLPRITDQLQQAHVNFQVLVELLRGDFLADPALEVNGQPVTDGQEMYYLGISNGGIQGVAFAALNQHIERFALHVAGGWWSMMIQRSSNFATLAVALEVIYKDALDRLILLHMSQSLWDYTDPINFARLVREAPLPGHQPKRVLLQESKYDDQVPNIATRGVVRQLGLKLMTPAVESIYGVEEQAGPLDSAYVQWDIDPPVKPPDANVPAPKPAEGSAHNGVRTLESCISQWEQFFRPDGVVHHACDGPCGKE